MAVAVALGLIWEILYRCKGNNKIRNDGGKCSSLIHIPIPRMVPWAGLFVVWLR